MPSTPIPDKGGGRRNTRTTRSRNDARRRLPIRAPSASERVQALGNTVSGEKRRSDGRTEGKVEVPRRVPHSCPGNEPHEHRPRRSRTRVGDGGAHVRESRKIKKSKSYAEASTNQSRDRQGVVQEAPDDQNRVPHSCPGTAPHICRRRQSRTRVGDGRAHVRESRKIKKSKSCAEASTNQSRDRQPAGASNIRSIRRRQNVSARAGQPGSNPRA